MNVKAPAVAVEGQDFQCSRQID